MRIIDYLRYNKIVCSIDLKNKGNNFVDILFN